MVDPLEGHFFPAFSTSPHSNISGYFPSKRTIVELNWIEKMTEILYPYNPRGIFETGGVKLDFSVQEVPDYVY